MRGRFKRLFQDPVDDKVRITPNGRCEVGIAVKSQTEMAQVLSRIASLFHRTEEEMIDQPLVRAPFGMLEQRLEGLRMQGICRFLGLAFR